MGCKKGILSKGEIEPILKDGIITIPREKILRVKTSADHLLTDDEQAFFCALYEDTYFKPGPEGIYTRYYEVTATYILVEGMFPNGGQYDTSLPPGASDLEIYMVTPPSFNFSEWWNGLLWWQKALVVVGGVATGGGVVLAIAKLRKSS